MLPTDFPHSNFTYSKPESMTDEQCTSLPVWRGEVKGDEQGTLFPAIISRWQLSREDLDLILKTGCVWLSVTAMVMPPVSVFVEDPFENVIIPPKL